VIALPRRFVVSSWRFLLLSLAPSVRVDFWSEVFDVLGEPTSRNGTLQAHGRYDILTPCIAEEGGAFREVYDGSILVVDRLWIEGCRCHMS